ncbi:transposase [Pseudomonas sp. JDS28PS106]|uniref:transposase n=1 Tax=Pseudomonas sp. JDS28PS106 TaxID=2497235 RepID=UPI002FD62FF1
MIVGAQLVVPEGYGALSAGITYYFLMNDPLHNRVRLLEFRDDGKEIKTFLMTLTTIDFEEGLELGLIQEQPSAPKLPPWLAPIQGIAVSHLEQCRVSAKESYDQKVNRRFVAIADLVQRVREVLTSENPDAVINAHAKSQTPQQNAARLRLWFYTYVTFGHNKWALMPPLHRIGAWSREGPNRLRKLGRPSPRGKHAGYRCDERMKEKIGAGFVRYKSPYKTWTTIYREILTKEFGCVATEIDGNFTFRHPDGLPFPSGHQIKYWIKQQFDSKTRSIAVRGTHKTRAQSGDSGSFAERLTNVNQTIEFDGYYISEKLSGLTEGSVVDSFCVVRAVCALSGMIVGIGFAEGKENLQAYLMCLFSMAVNKVKFCEFFGCTITPDQWPCEGLSASIIFDRGPGSALEVEEQINWLGTFEHTPVYSGQSKASVESSHPRDKKTLDQPTYFHSRLNFVEMAKREIFQVLDNNWTSDASGRMEETMYLAGVKPSPLGVWNYWNSRGRNSSIGMHFEEAVKKFLVPPHPAVIRQDAVYFYGRKYRSPELVETGIFDRVAKAGVIQTCVYSLTMCVRHIWIEVAGVLYTLDMVRSQRTLDDEVDISLRDLQDIDRIRRESSASFREERLAGQQYFRDKYKRETGQEWDAGERKSGAVPKAGGSQRDMADYWRFLGKAK